MIRFAFALCSLLLAASLSGAQAQVGEPSTTLGNLDGYTRTGNTLTAPEGQRITLTSRGPYLAGAAVTLPTLDPDAAGQLLGVLSGYGERIAPVYRQYLSDSRNTAVLKTGTTVVIGRYDLRTRLVGTGLTFSVKLHEVPASTFIATQNATGPARAAVVLRLFSDFQCPYCEQFETQTWPALKPLLPAGSRFEFHHLPLESIHPNARAAAEASECAAAQGQFWTFKDALFVPEVWQRWTRSGNPAPDFLSIAQSLKLDDGAFKTCLASRAGKARVDAEVAEATAVRVSGTPTLFVNGYQVENIYDPASTLKLAQYVLGK
jgi:protein-disulfide isomerase